MLKTKYRQEVETFMSDGLLQDYIDKYSALSGRNTVEQNGAFGKKFNTVWLMNEDSVFVPVGGVSTTAATVTKGTNSITVASASGLANGMEIVVNYGLPTEFHTSIASISGVVVTLEDIIPYELTNATVRECITDGSEALTLNPRNVIWGIQRDFTVEYQRDAEFERNNFYVSIRSDLKVENAEAIAYIKNLQSR
jgi:hypothetical protein